MVNILPSENLVIYHYVCSNRHKITGILSPQSKCHIYDLERNIKEIMLRRNLPRAGKGPITEMSAVAGRNNDVSPEAQVTLGVEDWPPKFGLGSGVVFSDTNFIFVSLELRFRPPPGRPFVTRVASPQTACVLFSLLLYASGSTLCRNKIL